MTIDRETFLLDDRDALRRAIDERVNNVPLPPALVFNCHITGLAVARSLGARGVPVIALDKDERGVGLHSRHVAVRGRLPSPLDDEGAFVARLLEIGALLDRRGVLFPANDEWVLGLGRHRARLAEYYDIPFADEATVARILDKKSLYEVAGALDIPVPRTWDLAERDAARLAREVAYPCILKPREQRSFTERFGVKVIEIPDAAEFVDWARRTAGQGMLAQEIVPVTPDGFHSLCAYVTPDGTTLGAFVGRKVEQYPAGFGTGCLVESAALPLLVERGARVLRALGYHGIAEVEFLYDPRDGEHKLLDVNTRVWKWIGLPIAAGVDLPWLAYATTIGPLTVGPLTVGQRVEPVAPRPDALTWVYLKDYMALRRSGGAARADDSLSEAQWLALITGRAREAGVVEAVLDPDDPRPFYQLLQTEMEGSRYFCAC
jgi:D-aspartate ligase